MLFDDISSGPRFATVWVERVNGSSGEVTCTYRTEDRTATAEKDYDACEGVPLPTTVAR